MSRGFQQNAFGEWVPFDDDLDPLELPEFLKRPRDPEVEARIEASRVKVTNRGILKRKSVA